MTEDEQEAAMAIFKGSLGLIPFVGSLAAELAGLSVKSLKNERIDKMLMELHTRVQTVEFESLRKRLEDPKYLDLLEDGVYDASRSLIDERIKVVAQVLATGAVAENLEHPLLKQVLRSLNGLEDVPLAIVIWMARQGTNAFHAFNLDEQIPTLLRANDSIADAAVTQELARDYIMQLERQGLLHLEIKKVSGQLYPRGGPDPTDPWSIGKEGDFVSVYFLTGFGKLLAQHICVALDIPPITEVDTNEFYSKR